MPIDFQIVHGRRLVLAKAIGIVTAEEFFAYQRELWSLAETRGYDELLDLSAVGQIVSPTSENVQKLADLAASMDDATIATRFAIVAPGDFVYGMSRMYETYRNLKSRGTKEIRVFRSMEEATDWIEGK